MVNSLYAADNSMNVTIKSTVPGTGATALGKAEDAAHVSGDTGVFVLGVRKDTAVATAADGDYTPLETDANGRLHVKTETEGAQADAAWTTGSGSLVALLKAIAAAAISTNPVQVYGANSYSNLAANATTTIKSGAGTLVGVAINTKGASSNTCTIYDNTAGSGTKIATIDTVNINTNFLPYTASFATGLTVVIATGTAADMTFIYR